MQVRLGGDDAEFAPLTAQTPAIMMLALQHRVDIAKDLVTDGRPDYDVRVVCKRAKAELVLAATHVRRVAFSARRRLEQVNNWAFDPFAFQEDDPELLGVAAYIFAALGMPRLCGVPIEAFLGFSDHVRYLSTQTEVPFHNWWHALHTLQVRLQHAPLEMARARVSLCAY